MNRSRTIRPIVLAAMLVGMIFAAAPTVFAQTAEAAGRPTFVIENGLPESAGSVDGRLILVLSPTKEMNYEGIDDGAQLFGVDIHQFGPGDVATIDATTPGAPADSLYDLPKGKYFVEAIVNKYTTFERSDGHTVKLHHDQGEGQLWYASPGNLRSPTIEIDYDPDTATAHRIRISDVIPPVELPADNEWVRGFSMISDSVSEFWGQPMEISARVLLPKGFDDNPDARYPLVIWHGHHYTGNPNPGNFIIPGTTPKPAPTPRPRHYWDAEKFTADWLSDDFPRFILITIQHATPYFDDSYAVNSANMGPYGDALTYEFIPALEKEFRAIGKPWARLLTGGSTGGWEALAAQIWYPDEYGGAWSFYPDPVDFHYYQLIDFYAENGNAFRRKTDFTSVPIPSARNLDGSLMFTVEQEFRREEIIGTRSRGGGQWAAWNATFAPVAEDGYPEPFWHPETGDINQSAVQYAIEHYEIVHKLRENWPELGPKLLGKLNIFMGRRDNFYLEQAVYSLEAFLAETESPHVPGRFEYGVEGEHGWSPWLDNNDPGGVFREMHEHLQRTAPAAAEF